MNKNSNDFIYLNQDQVLCFLHGIQLIRDKNPHFNDAICIQFEKYCLERCCEIVKYSSIKLLLVPHAKKIKISKSLFDYLTRLTLIDVYNKDEVYEKAKSINERAMKELLLKYNGRESSDEEKQPRLLEISSDNPKYIKTLKKSCKK